MLLMSCRDVVAAAKAAGAGAVAGHPPGRLGCLHPLPLRRLGPHRLRRRHDVDQRGMSWECVVTEDGRDDDDAIVIKLLDLSTYEDIVVVVVVVVIKLVELKVVTNV